jgi:hypothetical protein
MVSMPISFSRRAGAFAILPFVLGLGTSMAQPREPGRAMAANAASEIWSGCSGGYCIDWTTTDITAAKAGTSSGALALSSELRSAFNRDEAELRSDRATSISPQAAPAESDACTREVNTTLLSVVGPVLSIRNTEMTTCRAEAHPAGETRIIAVDLAKAAPQGASGAELNPVPLTDYVPANAILSALRKDSLVQKVLKATGSSPATLDQLVDDLASAPPVLEDGRCYSFPDDLLTRFTFHSIKNDQVAVRIGLPGAGPCRENLTMIGIQVPAPRHLMSALRLAASRKEGFLNKDAQAVAKGQKTTVTFRTKE